MVNKSAKQSRANNNHEEKVPICSSCHKEYHNSARSKQCLNYKLTKAEVYRNDRPGAFQ